MDIEYLDPFNTALPHTIESTLNEGDDDDRITTIELSPSGYWLATGYSEGECKIWDMLTNSVIYTIPAPDEVAENVKNAFVKSICWSLIRKSILISHGSGYTAEWSIGERKRTVAIPAQENVMLAVYLKDGRLLIVDEMMAHVFEDGMSLYEVAFDEPATAATLFAGNSTLVVGNGVGELIFYNASNLEYLDKNAEIGSTILKICTHHSKTSMLMTVLKDRTIKLFRVMERTKLTFHLKFVDVINKTQWAAAGFSHDSELAFGAEKSKGDRKICLWELVNGTILKRLEGPRDELVDVKWHAKRPIVVSLGKSGCCYVWKPQYPKKWSALFPGMTEVEENVEYVEREDEFDEIQQEESSVKLEAKRDETEVIDIVSPIPSITADDITELRLFHKTC